MRRGASRALAVVALLAAAGAVVAIVVGREGGGTGGSTERAAPGQSAGSGDRVLPTVVPGNEVRNARPQPDWRPYSGPVPILRYHAVGEPGRRKGFSELFVPAEDFKAQMDWLRQHGYEAVTLATVQRAWFADGTLPSKPIVLSFDGVEGDLLEVVAPELRRRGWPGVLAIDPGAAAKGAAGIARVVASGWELEAEGGEPAASRALLESEFATPIANFAFPQGESTDETQTSALRKAGYNGATATGYGFAESRRPFDQPRITVFGLSRIEGFVEALRSRGGGVGA